jgi:SAM-dependent methyltransferase
LKTSACCDANAVPAWLKPLLSKVHPEICNRYYGCGLVCPEHINGFKVLDLGSGAGRDAYLLAQLVGPTGEVVGVDTPSARKVDAFLFKSLGGLMEQINASIQRGCSN